MGPRVEPALDSAVVVILQLIGRWHDRRLAIPMDGNARRPQAPSASYHRVV
jgi:hypothetical protein